MLRSLRLCGGAILLVVSTSTCVRGDPSAIDDGWRRTAEGWELLHTRSVLAVTDSSRPQKVFHPLLLAALQVGFVAAAYWRFPVQK